MPNKTCQTLPMGSHIPAEFIPWWVEPYTPEVGWALGDGKEHGDDSAWDVAEAEALYGLLEREVVSTGVTYHLRPSKMTSHIASRSEIVFSCSTSSGRIL